MSGRWLRGETEKQNNTLDTREATAYLSPRYGNGTRGENGVAAMDLYEPELTSLMMVVFVGLVAGLWLWRPLRSDGRRR